MRVVGLEQDVVGADGFDDLRGRLLLEEVAAVHLAAEVVARLHVEVVAVLPHLPGLERVVGGFEDERHEADAALDRHELEAPGSAASTPDISRSTIWVPLSRNRFTETVAYVAPIPCARTRPGANPLMKSALPMWKLIGRPASWAADHSGSQCQSPRKGRSKYWGSPVNRIPRCPLRGAALDLGDGRVDVPERRGHDRDEALGRDRDPVEQEVVVRLHARQHQLGVLRAGGTPGSRSRRRWGRAPAPTRRSSRGTRAGRRGRTPPAALRPCCEARPGTDRANRRWRCDRRAPARCCRRRTRRRARRLRARAGAPGRAASPAPAPTRRRPAR